MWLKQWLTSLYRRDDTVVLKDVVVHPLLKKPSLHPIVLNNFCPVSNLPFGEGCPLPFGGKVVEDWLVYNYKGPWMKWIIWTFSVGFRQEHSTETALVTLVDDLWRAWDRGGVTLLAHLDLVVVSSIINLDIFLDRLWELGVWDTVMMILLLSPWLVSVGVGMEGMVEP